MRHISLFILLIFAVLTMKAEVAPVHFWNFDKLDYKKRSVDLGAAAKKKNMMGVIGKGKGFRKTNGILGEGKNNAQVDLDIGYPEFTVELKFFLNEASGNKKSRGLFNYEFHSWNRSCFRLRINKDNKIEAFVQLMDLADRKKRLKHFFASSKQLDLQARKWYTLRFAARKGGQARMWLDGKLIAAQDKAVGLDELNDGKKREYKYRIRLGWDTTVPRLGHGPLNGVIDDLKIWNKFVEPPMVASAMAESGSARNIAFTKGKGEWSTPFIVADREGKALDSYVKTDSKFTRNAAKVHTKINDGSLIINFKCPVPEGMKPKAGSGIWKGDCVEFFLRPDINSQVYYQYAAGFGGKTKKVRYTRRLIPDKSWQSKAVIEQYEKPGSFYIKMKIPHSELGLDKIASGTLMSANFCRCGPTAGGMSSWSPVNRDFHAIDMFGPVVLGSRKRFFDKVLNGNKKQLAGLKCSPGTRNDIKKKLAGFESLKNTRGNDPRLFKNLMKVTENIRCMFISAGMANAKYIVWRPDVWGNNIKPTLMSSQLDKIKLTAAANSRILYGMVLSNITDKTFLGQMKCLPKWPLQGPGKQFNREPWNNFCNQIKFSEGLAVHSLSGSLLYDPVVPLRMGTLVRTAPKDNSLLWMTISTKNLSPGTHKGVIVFKPAYSMFPVKTIELEVDVLPVDLGKIKLDSFAYFLTTERPLDTKYNRYGALYKFSADLENNYLFGGHLREVYPDMDAKGNIKAIDYTLIDKKIELYIKSGIPKDRLKLMFHLHTFIMFRFVKGKHTAPRHKYGTPEWERGFSQFLKKFIPHLKEKFNISPERIVIYPGDEPEGDVNDPKSKMYRVNYLAKLIRGVVPGVKLMTNPFSRKKIDKVYFNALEQLCKTYDIFTLHRSRSTKPEVIKFLKERNKTLWSYRVLNNMVAPEVYRRMYWQNFNDGMGSVAAYWVVDDAAGGDGFDPSDFRGNYCGGYSKHRTDYGSTYCDLNYGTIISGRRCEAHYQGFLDYKALILCRKLIAKQKAAGKSVNTYQEQLNSIVKRAMNGNCDAMDKCHVELLNLIEKLQF